MAQRKYARMGEKSDSYECTNRKCKWQGKDEQKVWKRLTKHEGELTCPKCGNSTFYCLLTINH